VTSSPGTAARLARLLAEIAIDAEALDARAADLSALVERVGGRAPSRDEVLLVAVNLHGWYTGLETLLERVARLLDDTVPVGPSWHSELLAQMMVEVPGLRPSVLSTAAAGDLAELRRFRHFFRNAYVLRFDADKVIAHAERVRRVQPTAKQGIASLQEHLREVLAELAKS
jgi:hypothetical protein